MTSRRSRLRTALIVAAILVPVVWSAAGIRRIDPSREFGVRTWRGSHDPQVLSGGIVWAPPFASGLTRFPTGSVELTLPDADEAMLVSDDGSRFGLKGNITIVSELAHARELYAAASGRGLRGVLVAAVRASSGTLADADRDERMVSPRMLAFEKRLRDELAARGALLEKLRLEGFGDLHAAQPKMPVPPDVHVLVVGLDGADWRIVDPLMAAGRMPNLKRLVDRGVRANLLSISPMLSPVIWTSIATGVEPARHGVMDFLAPAAGGASEPVTSAARRVPAVWEILSDAGARVGVTGWWATWPADAVNGYMVTDRVAYQLFGYGSDPRSAAGKTHPADAYDVIRPLIEPADAVSWSDVLGYLDGPRTRPDEFDADEKHRIDEFRTLLAAGQTYMKCALAMRRRDNVQFETVYFEGTDTIGHLFMSFRPPRLPSASAAGFASFHDVVDRYYETADRMLGAMLQERDGWTVLVVSDHGFASDATRPLTTDSRIGHGAAADWHRRFGIFVMSGPGVRRGMRLDQASVYDIAPTVLALFHQPVPQSWPGRVLGKALEPELLAANPVRLRVDDPIRRGVAAAVPDEHQEANELREKLQSLGYVSSAAAQPMTTKNNNGVALLADGKFKEAAEFFRQALKDDPDRPTLMINLGIALRFSGARAEARQLFERSFSTVEGRRAAGQQLAQMALDDHDFVSAERILRRVLEGEGSAAEVRNALGLVLENEGRTAEAAVEYNEAARLDPNASEPRNNLGNLAKKARRLEEAETWYLAAIAADPYAMGAYNNLALLCQERGQFDRAIDLYGRALAKAPTNAVAMNNLASLYFATGQNRDARALWRKAVESDPRYPSPLNNLAGMALADGDDQAALELLDRALALDPNYGDARINRALVARKRGDVDAARRELELALKDPRAEPTARMHLGFLDLEAGRARQAAEALEEARRELGDRTDLLNALGESYSRLNDRPKALAALKKSLAMDQTQAGVRADIENLEKQ